MVTRQKNIDSFQNEPDTKIILCSIKAAGVGITLTAASIVAFVAHGGDGCISVTSNVAPALCVELHRAWAKKDWDRIAYLRDLLLPLHDAMFVESNPAPVKYAAAQLGFGDGSLRLPLCEISEKSKEVVLSALRVAGVLK